MSPASMLAVAGLALVPAVGSGQEPPRLPQSEEALRLDVARTLTAVDARLKVADGAEETALHLERLRLLYFMSVAEEAYLAIARAQVDRIEALAERSDDPVAAAFRAALVVVSGKHAFWPHQKLGRVRDGLADLDAVVEQHPEVTEVRYLRLMSCYYLPFFFGRSETVEADMVALSTLLLRGPGGLSLRAYRAVADFVLENGGLGPGAEEALGAALAAAKAGEADLLRSPGADLEGEP